MIVDSSSLLAILLHEPERTRHLQIIMKHNGFSISAASIVEINIVLLRRRAFIKPSDVSMLVKQLQGIVVPVTEEQASLAIQAFEQYGKGRHPAQLNFGDCFSYALAKYLDEPILFKGNDFSQTDLKRA